MSEKRYLVPKGMVQAGATGWLAARGEDGKLNPMEVSRSVLIESLRWLAEGQYNSGESPTFTPERYEEVIKALDWRAASYPPYWIASGIIAEWHRQMFLAEDEKAG